MLEGEFNYDVWFEGKHVRAHSIFINVYRQSLLLLIAKYFYSDHDIKRVPKDIIIYICKMVWKEMQTKYKDCNLINFYFFDILDDETGKYMGISYRRVKWFLLGAVHLRDCTLTYKKLWEPAVKLKLLNELQEISKRLINSSEYDIPCICKDFTTCQSSHCLNDCVKKEMINYKKRKRVEIDLQARRCFKLGDDCGLDDEAANALTMYAYNGEHKKGDNFVRRIREWNSNYFVGDYLEKDILKIIIYDHILLQPTEETFESFWDSSPMSGLQEVISDYLSNQETNVKSVLPRNEYKKLKKLRKNFNESSNVTLTIFDLYHLTRCSFSL